MNIERKMKKILCYLNDEAVDNYMIYSCDTNELREIVKKLNGEIVGFYKIVGDGRITYDQQLNKFTTTIGLDKL